MVSWWDKTPAVKSVQKQIIKRYFNIPEVDAVFIFGSQAKGRTTAESDVDIAVLYANGSVPGVEDILDIKENLASQLKLRVDLVVLNRANPILAHQVLKLNTLLINKNPAHLKTFFVRHTTQYADLKRSRKIIEDKMLKRRLYG